MKTTTKWVCSTLLFIAVLLSLLCCATLTGTAQENDATNTTAEDESALQKLPTAGSPQQSTNFAQVRSNPTSLTAGTYNLSPGTPYIGDLGDGWTVNAGADATRYVQGVEFYVSTTDSYTLSGS